MFDTRKIDSFFSGEKNLFDEEEKSFISRRTRVVRFFKLFLPCLTVMLFAIGVALFDFSNSSDSSFVVDEEERIYFEKFRMNNTVFEITEKDNQISVIKADTVEETVAGSKIYDLTNPSAQSKNDETIITVVSKNGSYNQNSRILELLGNVVANYNNEMTVKTDDVLYNFYTMQGYGNNRIEGSGIKGTFSANRFSFNKKDSTITLIENVLLSNKDIEVSTPKEATLYANENKFIAQNAVVKKDDKILKGDTLTVFFKDTENFEIDRAYCVKNAEIHSKGEKAYADNIEYLPASLVINLNNNVKIVKGDNVATANKAVYHQAKEEFVLYDDVKIVKGDNVATANKAVYYQAKEEFVLYGKVKIKQQGTTASAEKGIYYIKKNVAELEKNVVISKDGNMVKGDKAISDFNTSKSRLIAKNGGRISGRLIESTLDKKED